MKKIYWVYGDRYGSFTYVPRLVRGIHSKITGFREQVAERRSQEYFHA